MFFLIDNFTDKIRTVFLFFSIIFFSVGQLGRVKIGQIEGFYLYEIFLILFTVLSLEKIKFSKLKSSLVISSVIFIVFLGISLIFSVNRYPYEYSFEAFLYFLRLAFYVFLISISPILLKSIYKNRLLKISVVVSFIFILLSSVIQILFFPKVGVLSYLGWDPHMYRVIGLFFDPPIAISFYVFFAFTILFLNLSNFYLKYGALITCLLLAIFTYSRGGYIALFITAFIFFIKLKKIKLMFLFLIMFIFLLTFISSNRLESVNLLRTTSVNSRVLSMYDGVSMFVNRPLVGIGYNQIKSERFINDPVSYNKNKDSNGITGFHSSFLIILVTGGVVGLVLFLIFLLNVAKISTLHFYSIIYLSVISLFDNVLLHPFILYQIFIIEFINKLFIKNPKTQ